MCGIAGLWLPYESDLGAAARWLDDMLACLVHRGPDDRGTWQDPTAGLFLGHRRLSVIDLSPLGHQPMVTGDGQLAIAFNGEIYNFRELRRELVARGARFASNSDTEVVLLGYRAWGEKLVDRLVGMYAFAIWDATTHELFLARDRVGEKPLYYATGPWGFAFASEATALAGLSAVDNEIDPEALALYLRYQYVPAPYSIYRGVRKLRPGHAMRVRVSAHSTWRYWDPAPLAAGPRLKIREEDAIVELESLLRTAVRGQMIADVPLGAFISGGIDSTAVVSLMAELSATPVRTFTVGFDDARFDESTHAGAVARHLGTQHTVEVLTEREALELIPRVPHIYGEPFADSSALPTYLVSRVARQHVTVCLSGDGGDEALGGYSRYRHLIVAARYSRLAGPFAPMVKPIAAQLPGLLGRGAPLLGLAPHEIYEWMLALFDPSEVQALVGRVPPPAEYTRAWTVAARQPILQRAMLTDLLTYLPEAILVKVDRAAMAVSLETRAPLLDHRVLEFALRLPPALVDRKRLLKRLVYKRIPRTLVDRPKQGFGVPLARWFRTELRSLLRDTLTPARMQHAGVKDYGVVRRVIDEHMNNSADHSARLWALLVLGLWSESARSPRQAPHARGRPETPAAGPPVVREVTLASTGGAG